MSLSSCRKTRVLHLACLCGVLLLAAPSREASARQQEPSAPRAAAEKIDEYGRVGHCDLTARLDNLAVKLQNDPEARGYLVGFDPPRRQGVHAEGYVKRAAAYLVLSRGIDESRVVMRYGGRHDVDDIKTELWVVPRDAFLPLSTTPLGEREDGRELSGRLETYPTEDAPVALEDEMGGPSQADIGQLYFARALKKQPASQGYLVVYTKSGDLPGAWRRIARREEQSLRDKFELPAGRVRVVNGGTAGETRVELWVQPKDAPPPVKDAREEKPLAEAFKLYELGNGHFLAGGAAEDKRLLADFADLLNTDARTRLSLIVHPPAPQGEEVEEADAETVQNAAATPAAAEEQSEVEDYEQKARRWRESVAKQYGIAPERVVVTVGRNNSSGVESLEVWVVPAAAPMPDAFAPEPEAETEPTVENEEEGAAPPSR